MAGNRQNPAEKRAKGTTNGPKSPPNTPELAENDRDSGGVLRRIWRVSAIPTEIPGFFCWTRKFFGDGRWIRRGGFGDQRPPPPRPWMRL